MGRTPTAAQLAAQHRERRQKMTEFREHDDAELAEYFAAERAGDHERAHDIARRRHERSRRSMGVLEAERLRAKRDGSMGAVSAIPKAETALQGGSPENVVAGPSHAAAPGRRAGDPPSSADALRRPDQAASPAASPPAGEG